MLRSSCVMISLLFSALTGWAQQTEAVVQVGTFVPAGTLLRCTLDEPNFSSQTAQVGDPVLCHTSSVQMFGRPLIPRGAYLTARLQEYRDPGHFFGKGWIQLEFTSLTLPSGNFPLNAKVISAGRYRVNAAGQIRGRGHATRDAIEWSIPILWPIKILTLPARGPRPAFKGETRIELRLMEDIMIPESANSAPSARTSRSSTALPRTDEKEARLPTFRSLNVGSGNISLPGQQPPPSTGMERYGTTLTALPRTDEKEARLPTFRSLNIGSGSISLPGQQPPPSTAIERYGTTLVRDQTQSTAAQPRLTLLVARGGLVYLASDYWVDNEYVKYTTDEGTPQALALDALDIPLTRRINAERGVRFLLTVEHR